MYLEFVFFVDPASDFSSLGSPIFSLFSEASTAAAVSVGERQATSTKASYKENMDFYGGGLGRFHVDIYECASFAEG